MTELTKDPSAPPGEQPRESSPNGTLFERARAMVESGSTTDDVKTMLAASGLDDESVRVLLNSLPNAKVPAALPEPNVSLTTNPFAPDLFSLTELGLTGDPATVGLYWLVFSAVLLVVLLIVLFLPLPQLFGSEGPSDAFLYFVDVVLPPAGFGLVAIAFARGAYLFAKGRRFRFQRRK